VAQAHKDRTRNSCARHTRTYRLPVDSSTAIEIGVGGVQKLSRMLVLGGKRRGSPGEPRGTAGGDSVHQGVDVS
jgi:hypothetical protein